MANTLEQFGDMVNEYITEELLRDEMVEKAYVWNKIAKDDSWKGGDYIVPFQGGQASSFNYGGLVPIAKINQSTYVRGAVPGYVEMWGALIFNYKDIVTHKQVSEQNFLNLLKDELPQYMERWAFLTSLQILNGKAIATLTADADASGNMEVDRPEHFTIGMRVYVDDDDSAAVEGFVKSINMETSIVNVVTALGGSTGVDLSAYDVAQNAKVYLPGAQADGFASIKDALLSATNGGSTELYGETKTDYPFLQAYNKSGATVDAGNLLPTIFNTLVVAKRIGKGKPTEVWMSYKHWGVAVAQMQASKGAFYVVPGETSTTVYPWDEITIGSPKGKLKFVAIPEMADDAIMIIDWSALKFASNGMIEKVRTPDGNEFYVNRSDTDGYQFVVDIRLFGQIIVRRPASCAIIHSIPDYATEEAA